MKLILLYLSLILSVFSFAQEKNDILQFFDTKGMETSILVQESPLINLEKYNYKKNTVYDFYQAYKTISQSDLNDRFPNLNYLKTLNKQSFFTKVIPLSILISSYETINNESFKNNDITHNENGFLIRTNNNSIFKKNQLHLASALRSKSKGLLTNYRLDLNDVFNTTDNKITYLLIDFGNNEGFKKINYNSLIPIKYLSAGHKTITYQIHYNNGQVEELTSAIEIIYSSEDLSNLFNRSLSNFTSSIIPDLSMYGETDSYAGEGEYEIFLSTETNAKLDKPVFIVDGFDPYDSRPILGYTDSGTGKYIEGIYDILNFKDNQNTTQNLGDLLRAEGFDIVVLNFPVYTRVADNTIVDGGVDYIERNAMLLVDLINHINNEKVGDEPNVVIGPSMGGLITQYALNYMENQSLNHNTRLWIAFDSPLQGANVPIGFQHHFNFLANGLNDFTFIGNQNVEDLQPIVNGMMKSNAARQMLVDQFEAHITDSDGVTFNSSLNQPQKHPFFNIFYDKLHALTSTGFPEEPRKIAIVNGSKTGASYFDKNGNDILPGREIVNTNLNVDTGTDAYLKVSYTPYADTSLKTSSVYIDFAWYIPAFDVENNAYSQSFIYSDGVDAAPGGLFDLSKVTDQVSSDGITGEFVNSLQTDYFNFIPAVSAMAIEFQNNEIDWMQLMNTTNLINKTPFDAWIIPEINENHITLTPSNVEFAWNEIVKSTANTNSISSFKFNMINPITNHLLVLNSSSLINKVTIYNELGSKVLNVIIKPSKNINIPIELSNGIYISKINCNNSIITKKIIIVN